MKDSRYRQHQRAMLGLVVALGVVLILSAPAWSTVTIEGAVTMSAPLLSLLTMYGKYLWDNKAEDEHDDGHNGVRDEGS